ncbi:hypothetical protein [Bacillus sp. CECT 9360]|nr:hypothetical protein [Bacillus sp. CECT 9360]CAH0344274.1 hypothetical protein BCI9360_00518 [Bacillus sp. CECT 9360]
MKKWALAAIIYLAAVIGGYSAYDAFIADEQVPVQEHENHTEETE